MSKERKFKRRWTFITQLQNIFEVFDEKLFEISKTAVAESVVWRKMLREIIAIKNYQEKARNWNWRGGLSLINQRKDAILSVRIICPGIIRCRPATRWFSINEVERGTMHRRSTRRETRASASRVFFFFFCERPGSPRINPRFQFN